MKVILQDDIKSVGRKFEIKDVSNGYAQNYLIPNKKAIQATPSAIAMANKQRELHERSIAASETEITNLFAKIDTDTVITVSTKGTETGSLYAGIDETAIAHAISEAFNISLDPDIIQIDEHFKNEGDYTVMLKHGNNEKELKVAVKAIVQ